MNPVTYEPGRSYVMVRWPSRHESERRAFIHDASPAGLAALIKQTTEIRDALAALAATAPDTQPAIEPVEHHHAS